MKNINNYMRVLRSIVAKLTHHFLVYVVITSLFCGALKACPTCIGVIEHDAPKFFSNDAYQLVQENHGEHASVSGVMQEEKK